MEAIKKIANNESGATVIYVAIILGVLMMFTALAIDVGHLYGVRNEMQNAADAGALAGASALFDSETGELTALVAQDEATDVVNLNKSGNESVSIKSVEIGHWSFHSPSHSFDGVEGGLEGLEQLEGWQQMSASRLDGESGYINAVKVVTERAAPKFFSWIFDKVNGGIPVSAEAVAYIGFAGNFKPGDFDQPIAICQQSISRKCEGLTKDCLECNVGRMINSGNSPSSSNTGAWTNFTQPCATANPPSVSPFVCASGNPTELAPTGMGTTNGMTDPVFQDLLTCWNGATNKRKNWSLVLPVVNCPSNAISNCATLVGAVSLNVIWMIDQTSQSEKNNKYSDVPRYMEIWDVVDGEPHLIDKFDNPTTTEPDNFEAWKDFVDKFNLKNADGKPETVNDPDDIDYQNLYQHKAIFFLPNCEFSKPTGGTGGNNFGVVARTPVLVQ